MVAIPQGVPDPARPPSSGTTASPFSERRKDLFPWFAVASLGLIVGGAGFVLVTGTSPASCHGSPTCVLSTGDLGGSVHEGIAFALLLCVLAMVLSAYRGRDRSPQRLMPSVLALALVVTTAGWGAALATGLFPGSWAFGVLVFLGATSGAILWALLAKPHPPVPLSG